MSIKKVCVVGAGYWGKNHIKTLHELGFLGGIVESNQETLNAITKQYPHIKGFISLDEALQEDHFLGFTVATPANTHYEIAKTIITSGNHILIEKPLTLQIDHAEKLVSLAPHDISIFQYFTDSFPEKITASGSTFLQKGIYDSTITQLQYPNGVEGHIFVSWLHPFKEHRLVVIGSEAMISFEDSVEGKPLKIYSKKFEMNNGFPGKVDGPIEIIKYEYKMPLKEELKYFTEHLSSVKPSIGNGKHATEVIKILVQASEQLDSY